MGTTVRKTRRYQRGNKVKSTSCEVKVIMDDHLDQISSPEESNKRGLLAEPMFYGPSDPTDTSVSLPIGKDVVCLTYLSRPLPPVVFHII